MLSRLSSRALVFAAISVLSVIASSVLGPSVEPQRTERAVRDRGSSSRPPSRAHAVSTAPAPHRARGPARTRPSSAGRAEAASLPVAGKGMWIYQMELVRKGDPARIARTAARLGLTHLYARVGSGWGSLRTLEQAGALLPAAHRRGIKVIGWYFPYFLDIDREVAEGRKAMRARFKGHRFDGLAIDIERAPGSRFSAARIERYSRKLQRVAGRTPLISVVPWPSSHQRASFPYPPAVRGYDAVAPMAYWGSFRPRRVAAESLRFLERFGVPVSPIGQAYDMGPEGGPRGVPHARALRAFMDESVRRGAIGVSFWSWQHARERHLRAIGGFRWRAAGRR